MYQKLSIHHWKPVCYFRDASRVFEIGIWVRKIIWGMIDTWYGSMMGEEDCGAWLSGSDLKYA